MQPFTERVLHQIQNIPVGKVMTYGQIAGLAGSPRGARQVARILHSMSQKYNLPWHRVISSRGELSFKNEEQLVALECEGVEVSKGGYVNLEEYLYHPQESKDGLR